MEKMSLQKRMEIINSCYDKYEEFFESKGDETPFYLNHVLANMLLQERDKNEYLTKRLKECESLKV